MPAGPGLLSAAPAGCSELRGGRNGIMCRHPCGSDMRHASPFRALVSVLLAAWMPFCCCSLRSLISACESCGGHQPVVVAAAAHAQTLAPANQHPGCHQQGDEPAPDSQPRPGHDDEQCTCGKARLATTDLFKSSIDFPMASVLYVLPPWSTDAVTPRVVAHHSRENRADSRPDSTLLRLHCALII